MRNGVVRPDVWVQFPDDGLVAAHLHVLARQDEGQPHQRVEPVDAQRAKKQQLNDMVQTADVVFLMEKDIRPFLLRQVGGKIDFRPEDANDKGGLDVVCQPDILIQMYRSNQPAPQPQQGNRAVQGHDHYSGQP